MKYTVRRGYTFFLNNKRHLEGDVLNLTDEEVKGQKWKLEPQISVREPVVEKKKEEKKEEVVKDKAMDEAPRNRMVKKDDAKTKA